MLHDMLRKSQTPGSMRIVALWPGQINRTSLPFRLLSHGHVPALALRSGLSVTGRRRVSPERHRRTVTLKAAIRPVRSKAEAGLIGLAQAAAPGTENGTMTLCVELRRCAGKPRGKHA
jgi:hypothetical protein